jgi:hypothetical protein
LPVCAYFVLPVCAYFVRNEPFFMKFDFRFMYSGSYNESIHTGIKFGRQCFYCMDHVSCVWSKSQVKNSSHFQFLFGISFPRGPLKEPTCCVVIPT